MSRIECTNQEADRAGVTRQLEIDCGLRDHSEAHDARQFP